MTDSTTARASEVAAIATLLRKLDICILTTNASDGGIHGRPMSNNGEVEYDGDSWFFAREGSRKVAEIDAEPRVQLGFIDSREATWINVEGDATVIRDDEERKRQLWQEDLGRWFENGPEDPEVVLIKVVARHIDAWSRSEDHSFDLPR